MKRTRPPIETKPCTHLRREMAALLPGASLSCPACGLFLRSHGSTLTLHAHGREWHRVLATLPTPQRTQGREAVAVW